MAFFFRHSGARSGWCAFYPSPMGPTESLLELDAWDGARGGQPGAARRSSPTSRRCSSTARAGAREHWLVPIDDCYALVGLIRTRWRGLTGGSEVWEEIDGVLRRRSTGARETRPSRGGRRGEHEDRQARRRAGLPAHTPGVKQGNAQGNYEKQAGHLPDGRSTAERSTGINPEGARADRPADAEPLAGRRPWRAPRVGRPRRRELAFAVRDAARVEHAAVPTLRFALRDRAPRAGSRSARSRSTSQIRIAATPARATTRREQDAAGRAVRRAERLGHDAAHAALDAHDARSCPPFTGRDGRRSAGAVHLRLRGRRRAQVPGRARRRRGAARVPVQRHASSTRAPTAGCRPARSAGTSEADVPAAGRGLARDDGPPLPRQRVAAAATRDASTGSRPTRRAHALPTWERRVDALLGGGGDERGPGARDRRRRALRGLRAVAVPALGAKNQQRWTFGGVYPRGAQRARIRTTAARCGPSACSRATRTRRRRRACASCTWCTGRCVRDGRAGRRAAAGRAA